MLAALLAALLQGASPVDTIASYRERIVLAADTTRVTVTVVLAATRGGVVEIPVAWPLVDGARLAVPAGASAEIQSGTPVSRLLVRSPPGAAVQIGAEFARRAAADVFVYRFANATGTVIDEYQLVIELPPGRLVRNVTYAVPASDRRPGVWPMSLDTIDGRRAVRLAVRGLAPGDVVPVTVEMAAERRSWTVLVVALGLAALYMLRFRDLTRRAPAGTETTAGG